MRNVSISRPTDSELVNNTHTPNQVSAVKLAEVHILGNYEAAYELKTIARRYFISCLSKLTAHATVTHVFPGLNKNTSEYKLYYSKVQNNFKMWKYRSIGFAENWIARYIEVN